MNNKSVVPKKPKDQDVSDFDFLICPNCGETEVGNYCPNCGQSNRDFNKPIKEILDDLIDSLNLDIRLLNTLVPFLIKPGFLTEEYFKGRRKKYVPPVRMYMIFSILFFFLVQFTTSDEIKNDFVGDNTNELADSTEKKSNITEENQAVMIKSDSAQFKSLITSKNLEKQDLETIKEETLNDTSATSWEKQLVIGGLNAAKKKDVFFDRFLNSLSYVLFLLMPFFALILALILWKSRLLYVKHLIFSINFHSFIFAFSSILIVLIKIFPNLISHFIVYLWLGIPIYLMFGIKRFYKRTYIGAFFKTLGLLTLYSFIISIVLIVILAITATGFS